MNHRLSCTVDDETYQLLCDRAWTEGATSDPQRPVVGPIVRKAINQYLSRYCGAGRGRAAAARGAGEES